MIYSHEYACSELSLHEMDGGNRGTVGARFIWVGSLWRVRLFCYDLRLACIIKV
jgi:hypothetical protein